MTNKKVSLFIREKLTRLIVRLTTLTCVCFKAPLLITDLIHLLMNHWSKGDSKHLSLLLLLFLSFLLLLSDHLMECMAFSLFTPPHSPPPPAHLLLQPLSSTTSSSSSSFHPFLSPAPTSSLMKCKLWHLSSHQQFCGSRGRWVYCSVRLSGPKRHLRRGLTSCLLLALFVLPNFLFFSLSSSTSCSLRLSPLPLAS